MDGFSVGPFAPSELGARRHGGWKVLRGAHAERQPLLGVSGRWVNYLATLQKESRWVKGKGHSRTAR